MDIGPQLVVEEQLQLVSASRPVEENKLQQPMSNGEEFFQELFEERPISSIIPRCPRLETRTMMKQKVKALVEEHVEKLVKKKLVSKVKESQKLLQWMKMDSNKLKWAPCQFREPIQLAMENAKRRPITRLPTNLQSNGRWKNLRASMWLRDSHLSGTYS